MSSSQLSLFDEPIVHRPVVKTARFTFGAGDRFRSLDGRERKRIVDVVSFNPLTRKVKIKNIDLGTTTEVSLSRFIKSFEKVDNDTPSIPSTEDVAMRDVGHLVKLTSAILHLREEVAEERQRISHPEWQGNALERRSLLKLIGLIQAGCYLDAGRSLRRSPALRNMFKPLDALNAVCIHVQVVNKITTR